MSDQCCGESPAGITGSETSSYCFNTGCLCIFRDSITKETKNKTGGKEKQRERDRERERERETELVMVRCCNPES